jgi:hypothetical protein
MKFRERFYVAAVVTWQSGRPVGVVWRSSHRTRDRARLALDGPDAVAAQKRPLITSEEVFGPYELGKTSGALLSELRGRLWHRH